MEKASESAMSQIDRAVCRYTSNYCEENVWWLCKHLLETIEERVGGLQGPAEGPPRPSQSFSEIFVVFISNPARSVAIWRQQKSTSMQTPVVWDYHVILVLRRAGSSFVYDLDTQLAFPCIASEYLARSFPYADKIHPGFRPYFRVVAGESYLRLFASDRSHMRKDDGSWLASPPTYPSIVSETGETMNLERWINMIDHSSEPENSTKSSLVDAGGYGFVLGLEDFCRFAQASSAA